MKSYRKIRTPTHIPNGHFTNFNFLMFLHLNHAYNIHMPVMVNVIEKYKERAELQQAITRDLNCQLVSVHNIYGWTISTGHNAPIDEIAQPPFFKIVLVDLCQVENLFPSNVRLQCTGMVATALAYHTLIENIAEWHHETINHVLLMGHLYYTDCLREI